MRRVLGDLEGAADLLRARADVTGKVGCIGFCMGGRYTLLFACASDRLSAAVDCWGGFIDSATPEERSTPAAPDAAARARREAVLPAAGGGRRRGPEPLAASSARSCASSAAASGQEVKVDIYEGAGHAFFADYRPSYRPAAAQLWQRCPFLAAPGATARAPRAQRLPIVRAP